MHRHFWELLRPFRSACRHYLAGVVLRQALVVAGGYSLVWALRLCLAHTSVPEWMFVLAFVAFDAGYLTFDLKLNFYFSRSVSYPLFGRLRTGALEKIFQMPM